MSTTEYGLASGYPFFCFMSVCDSICIATITRQEICEVLENKNGKMDIIKHHVLFTYQLHYNP